MSSSYIYEKFFYIEPSISIDAFDKFVLSNENKERYCLYIPPTLDSIPIKNEPPPPSLQTQSTIVIPRCEDTLFWCGFIAGNGYKTFLQIGSKYKNKELEEKQAMMESIKKNPLQIKTTNHKLSNIAIQEIMSSLMVDKKTTLMSFIAICVYYNIQLV